MDEEVWTTVDFVVKLNGGLLGLVGIEAEVSVEKSEESSESPPTEEFTSWPVNVEEHSTN